MQSLLSMYKKKLNRTKSVRFSSNLIGVNLNVNIFYLTSPLKTKSLTFL